MAIDWDALYELTPSDTTYVKDTDDAIRSIKTATRERITKEHEFDLASQARQGLHRAGSAVAFYQASAPTQRNGVSLAAADAGLLWIDSDDKLTKVWDGDSMEGIRAASAVTADSATNATSAANADTVDSYHVTTTGDGLKAKHGYIIDESISSNDIFDAISPAIPNINDWCIVSGRLGPAKLICSRAYRNSSTVVAFEGCNEGGSSASSFSVTNGTADMISNVVISW